MGMRIRRWMPVLIAPCLLLAGVAAPAALAQPAGPAASEVVVADAGTESQFVSAINSLRASKGLNQLQVSGDLVGMARRWTDRMVGAGQISHNPNLGSEIGGPWTKMGENVGVGYDVVRPDAGVHQQPRPLRQPGRSRVDPRRRRRDLRRRRADVHDPQLHGPERGRGDVPGARGARLRTISARLGADPASDDDDHGPSAASAASPPEPHPTPERVTAVLDPLRSLEAG